MSEQNAERTPEAAVPRPAAPPDAPPAILAGDADRERSTETLTAAVVEGRRTLKECSDRVGLVHASRTQGETPAIAPGPGAPRLRISVRGPGATLHVRSPRTGD